MRRLIDAAREVLAHGVAHAQGCRVDAQGCGCDCDRANVVEGLRRAVRAAEHGAPWHYRTMRTRAPMPEHDLEALGVQGWELAAVTWMDRRGTATGVVLSRTYTYYFKRRGQS